MWVVFHNPNLTMIGPAVCVSSRVPITDLIRQSEAMFSTNVPDLATARFIGWWFAQPDQDTIGVGVDNLPVPSRWPDRYGPPGWYERLLAELAGWDPPPVLVDLEELAITQGGAVLWRAGKHAAPGAAADGGGS